MKFEHTQPYENWFWEKNRIDLKTAMSSRFKPIKRLMLESGEQVPLINDYCHRKYSNKFGWPGQDFQGVYNLVSKQDLSC
jgi:hypothetical protein